jgi:hypothetical protein
MPWQHLYIDGKQDFGSRLSAGEGEGGGAVRVRVQRTGVGEGEGVSEVKQYPSGRG